MMLGSLLFLQCETFCKKYNFGLRQAKGAPDGDGTAGRLVSWKPNANAEGLAGHGEATQVGPTGRTSPRGACCT